MRTFKNLLTYTDSSLNFYTKSRGNLGEARFLKKFTCSEPEGVINLHIPNFHEDLNHHYTELWLIGNLNDYLTDKHTQSQSFLEILVQLTKRSEEDLKSEFGDQIFFDQEKSFKQKVGKGFQIVDYREDKTCAIYMSRFKEPIRLRPLVKWEVGKVHISLYDRFLPVKDTVLHVYRCSNLTCTASHTTKAAAQKHEKSCQAGTEFVYDQVNKCSRLPRNFLVDKGVLDENFHLKTFATWDIETVSRSVSRTTAKTQITGYQAVVSIAVHKNFGIGPRTKVFVRKTDDHDGLLRLVRVPQLSDQNKCRA